MTSLPLVLVFTFFVTFSTGNLSFSTYSTYIWFSSYLFSSCVFTATTSTSLSFRLVFLVLTTVVAYDLDVTLG